MLCLDWYQPTCGFNIDSSKNLWPDTEATNEYYGGINIQATNVFFANGSQDPWKRASVSVPPNSFEPALGTNLNQCN
jgi:hypothetical protein